jgi:hypothetical protein
VIVPGRIGSGGAPGCPRRVRWHNALVDPKLPGADLIERGLADLARGVESVESLLVSIGASRLRQSGLEVPPGFPSPEHRLYQRLAAEDTDSAHSRYNALIRRLVSFERAVECVNTRT